MYPYDLLPNIDFLDVRLYGVMIALGLLACFFVLFFFGHKKGYSENFIDFIFYNAIISIVIGFLSAALFQSFYNFLSNPEGGFKLGGGITFIGGLIGGAGTFLIIYFAFRKKVSIPLIRFMNFAPPCILIAHAFGRLGCLFAGCCHGTFLGTNEVFGGLFMKGESGWGYYVPTQLYEALFLFVLFGVTLFLTMKKDFKHNLALYLIGYGVFRFIIEFVRADEARGVLFGLPPSQFWSIIMVIVGIALIFFVEWYYINKKPDTPTTTSDDQSVTTDNDEVKTDDVTQVPDGEVVEETAVESSTDELATQTNDTPTET